MGGFGRKCALKGHFRRPISTGLLTTTEKKHKTTTPDDTSTMTPTTTALTQQPA